MHCGTEVLVENIQVLQYTQRAIQGACLTKSRCPKNLELLLPASLVHLHAHHGSITKPKTSWHDTLRALDKKRKVNPLKKRKGIKMYNGCGTTSFPPAGFLKNVISWPSKRKNQWCKYRVERFELARFLSQTTKAHQPKTTKAQPNQTKQGAEMLGNPWAYHLWSSDIFIDIHYCIAKFSMFLNIFLLFIKWIFFK